MPSKRNLKNKQIFNSRNTLKKIRQLIIFNEKVDYRMTYTYIKYLKGKKLATLEDEISIFKNRLDYEYRNFGEVDDIDFQEYENTLKEYLKLKNEYEEKYNEKWR